MFSVCLNFLTLELCPYCFWTGPAYADLYFEDVHLPFKIVRWPKIATSEAVTLRKIFLHTRLNLLSSIGLKLLTIKTTLDKKNLGYVHPQDDWEIKK